MPRPGESDARRVMMDMHMLAIGGQERTVEELDALFAEAAALAADSSRSVSAKERRPEHPPADIPEPGAASPSSSSISQQQY